jgi:citrate synthase
MSQIPISDQDRIPVAGYDLVDDLIGKVSFTDLTYLLITDGDLPNEDHRAIIDALLVTFADHGVTPSSLAARLTLLGAPEAFQSAVAAGLSGVGSRYLGTLENSAEFLQRAIEESGGEDISILARSLVTRERAAGRFIPGFGHPEHKRGDPRVPRLIEVTKRHGGFGVHCQLLLEVGNAIAEDLRRSLPPNAAGFGGAMISDLGWPPASARGIALIARTAGLVGQLLDEQRKPTAQLIWDGLRDRESR